MEGTRGEFVSKLLCLEERVHMWPSPKQMLYRGQKSKLYANLDEAYKIASETGWPLVSKISDDQVENILGSRISHIRQLDFVLKRGYSDHSGHVVHRELVKETILALKVGLKKEHELWESVSDIVVPEWISMEWIPTLPNWGEYRAFVVRGLVHHIVHTSPDGSSLNADVGVFPIPSAHWPR